MIIRKVIVGRRRSTLSLKKSITSNTLSYEISYNNKVLVIFQASRKIFEKKINVIIKPSIFQKDIVSYLRKKSYKLIRSNGEYYTQIQIPYIRNFEELDIDMKQRINEVFDFIAFKLSETSTKMVEVGKLLTLEDVIKESIVSHKRGEYEGFGGVSIEEFNRVFRAVSEMVDKEDKEMIVNLVRKAFYDEEAKKKLMKLVDKYMK